MDISYRLIEDFVDFAKVIELEASVWGVGCVDIVPVHLLHTVGHNGGVLLGAFCGERLVGMCFGFPGRYGRDCFIWSHMTGVLEEFRGSGVGRQLKLMQREWCLVNDYAKIKWTFDPLQSQNANFNVCKLGATSRIYHVNYYGEMTDDINAGLPSDRLEVVWNLKAARARRKNHKKQHVLNEAMLISNREGIPTLVHLRQQASQTYIEIPSNLATLKKENPDLALRWRLATREAFQTAFANHYTVTDFIKFENRCFYVLTASQSWYMYVAECRDQTLYTGITNNLKRRINQHNAGKGAAYTAARRPVTLLAAWKFPDRSSAQRAEAAYKKQKRQAKLNQIRLQSTFLNGEHISSID